MISIKPARVSYDGSLDALLVDFDRKKYPIQPAAPAEGFGGITDDIAVVNAPSSLAFTPGQPVVDPAADGHPRRLRLRYYYDVLDKKIMAALGASVRWNVMNVRRAFDLTIIENSGEAGTSVLISARDMPTVKNHAVKALKLLFPSANSGPGGVAVEIDTIPESVESDFFVWMLYRLEEDQQLAPDVSISWVSELSSRDGMSRGARFTDDAAFGRLDVSALIAIGNSKFGPAKIDIRDDSLDANFRLEVHFDGGFVAFRDSHYSGVMVSSDALGPRLSDDLWLTVLPKIRTTYNNDTDWTSSGRDRLKAKARERVRELLGF